MRFVLSGAPLASIDRVRSGAEATDSHCADSFGAHQVAAGRSSGRFIKPNIQSRLLMRIHANGGLRPDWPH
jgi:hypothetical protein